MYKFGNLLEMLMILSGLVLLQQCPTQPVDLPEPGILTLEYTTTTALWIRVQVPDPVPKIGLRMYRDSVQIAHWGVATIDTVIVDTGLTPNTMYTYHTVRVQQGQEKSLSQSLSLTTLPTSSDNFSWSIDTLGNSEYGSSVLHDVAILDSNQIWVVGEIETDSGSYGAAIWNGIQWKVKKLQSGLTNVRPRGIWAISPTDIWFADGSIYHYNGHSVTLEWSRNIQTTETVKKVWGSSPSNLFFVGDDGTTVYYDGQTFTKLHSGTETTIQDIWGAPDPLTDDWTVLCAASPGYGVTGAGIYQITPEQTIESLLWVADRAVQSLWFNTPFEIFATGSGIFQQVQQNMWQEIGGVEVIPTMTRSIRGVAPNDLFVVGDFGYVAHYNGCHFKVWQPNPNILYESCAYKNNLLVAVGYDGSRAFVLRMSRIK